ncbi:hypothetical protein HNY73_015512 [Argiope bruennichi]|uniref:Uncharacterized protein n=1 Tax=Argiope bruennichi TaxID=94029 RepID=A0A8T0EWS5_ARGBR|nr:hypothetical protein HNY73_015512 [Argiope bruennichi]
MHVFARGGGYTEGVTDPHCRGRHGDTTWAEWWGNEHLRASPSSSLRFKETIALYDRDYYDKRIRSSPYHPQSQWPDESSTAIKGRLKAYTTDQWSAALPTLVTRNSVRLSRGSATNDGLLVYGSLSTTRRVFDPTPGDRGVGSQCSWRLNTILAKLRPVSNFLSWTKNYL